MKLKVRVIPNASRDEFAGWQGNELKIKVRAVPEGGRANKALITFLAAHWKLSKSRIRIIRGESSRTKVLEIDGINTKTLFALFPDIT